MTAGSVAFFQPYREAFKKAGKLIRQLEPIDNIGCMPDVERLTMSGDELC